MHRPDRTCATHRRKDREASSVAATFMLFSQISKSTHHGYLGLLGVLGGLTLFFSDAAQKAG